MFLSSLVAQDQDTSTIMTCGLQNITSARSLVTHRRFVGCSGPLMADTWPVEATTTWCVYGPVRSRSRSAAGVNIKELWRWVVVVIMILVFNLLLWIVLSLKFTFGYVVTITGFGLVFVAAKYTCNWRWDQRPSHPHLECKQRLLHQFSWHSVSGNYTLLDPFRFNGCSHLKCT